MTINPADTYPFDPNSEKSNPNNKVGRYYARWVQQIIYNSPNAIYFMQTNKYTSN